MPEGPTPEHHPLDIFFRHNNWSNQKLFATCLALDADVLDWQPAGTFGTIRAMLGHITFAEERYIFHITSGREMADAQRPDATTSLTDFRQRIARSSERLHQLAVTLNGSETVKLESGYSISIEALLLQAIHHGHEHRTQIETVLGMLGVEPAGLSAWRFYDENR